MAFLLRSLCSQRWRRYAHSESLHMTTTTKKKKKLDDPSYFGLFGPQREQNTMAQQGGHDVEEDEEEEEEEGGGEVVGESIKCKDTKIPWQVCMAFRDTFKEWSRTVPPEFISRPPASPKLFHRKGERNTSHHGKGDISSDDIDDTDDAEDIDDGDSEDIDDDDDSEDIDDDDDDDVDSEDIDDDDNFSNDEDEQENVSSDDDVFSDGHHDDPISAHKDDGQKDEYEGRSIDGMPDRDNDSIHEDMNWDNLEGIDDEYDDSHTYYITDSGKVRYKHLEIHAPKDEIYAKLSEGGLISPKFKKPLPVQKLLKKSDAEIVGWFYYCSIELLQFFRICHNLKEVKAIVEYHIRWSAICTLAKKHNCNEREIVKKYGRDLECEDKKGKKVRLMSRQEIKQVTRGVNKRVQMTHRFRALRILAEMD